MQNLNSFGESILREKEYTYENVVRFSPIQNNFLQNNKLINLLLTAISYFYDNVSRNTLDIEINDELKREMDFIMKKNHCVYFSLITKFLIEYCTNYKYKVNFNQGYYKFPNNSLATFILGTHSLGFHAWCDIDGIVIDTTFISQQYNSYKDEFSTTYFLGNQPDDVELVGHKESDKIISQYMIDLLKINNLSFEQWLKNYLKLFRIIK